MTSNTSEPGPEKSAASGSAYPECQDCETTINAQISRISNSVQRLEGLITKAIEALSLDVDLEDLETSHHEDNNAKGKEPMSNYGLYSEFWYTMGPGAEYSDVTRIHYEFLDFFCAENGTTLRPKECERSGSSPRRYINGTLARDDMSNEEVLALIKNAWPNHSVGFGKVEDLHSFASENCPAVQVQTVRYDETGFVRWAWGDESAFALFCEVSFSKLRDPSSIFSTLVLAMCSMAPPNHKRMVGETSRPALDFIQAFCDCWPSRTLTKRPFNMKSYYPGNAILTFSLRSLSKRRPTWHESTCLRRCRVKGTLGNMILDEERRSIILYTTVVRATSVEPFFTLLVFSDNEYSTSPRLSKSEERWPQLRLRPTLCHAGIAAFQWLVIESFIEWASEWEGFLDLLDENSDRQTGDVLTAAGRRIAMFDNENFEKSESYFATSQLLRISSSWIKQTMLDSQALVSSYYEMYENEFIKFHSESRDKLQRRELRIVKENWKCVRSSVNTRSKYLLERIQRKEVEIDSLRNGLFNATSVAEAQKSSQLSHYILVFTVITIFYLPLSFVTSLFALGLFQFDDDSDRNVFLTTISVVAVVTYLISFILAWFVRKEERRGILKGLLQRPNQLKRGEGVDGGDIHATMEKKKRHEEQDSQKTENNLRRRISRKMSRIKLAFKKNGDFDNWVNEESFEMTDV